MPLEQYHALHRETATNQAMAHHPHLRLKSVANGTVHPAIQESIRASVDLLDHLLEGG